VRLAEFLFRPFAYVAVAAAVLTPTGVALSFPGEIPFPDVSAVESVTLSPAKDNTLYESATGALSNGAGSHFFAGKTAGGSIRRGLLSFDLAGQIPAGSTVASVTLTLFMSKTSAGAKAATLHRLQADWGEGSSDAPSNEGGGTSASVGDATWLHSFFSTGLWDNAGGDFLLAPSASVSVDGLGSYTWGSTAQMVDDIQCWLDDPSTNFGWLLVGDEASNSTAKRFDFRENSTVANRPELMVEFTPSVQPGSIQFGNGVYGIAEGDGEADITVTRTGCSTGAVSAHYGITGGSADPATDYAPVSGTIAFADGEAGDKSFSVPIVDDPLVEGDETVEFSLSNPTGGAVLGSPSATVVTIEANDQAVDVNDDGVVDLLDLLVVVANFGPPPFIDPRADVDANDYVNILDLVAVARNFGATVTQ